MRIAPVLVCVLILCCGVAGGTLAAPVPDAGAAVPVAAPAGPPSLAPMLARVLPAVVTVSVRGMAPPNEASALQSQLLRNMLGLSGATGEIVKEPFHAMGSGVIYDAEHGYVITADHVIEHASKIQVTLSDRREFAAKLVGADPETDIAVLKIEANGLIALPSADPQALNVGDYVVAIGDAFGVGQTASFGIVSALGRTALGLARYEDFIQTDAAINPGNSGGALVDLDGRLVGINTAIVSRDGGNMGVGFAVPAAMARTVAEQLVAKGKVARGDLGADLQPLTPTLATALGAPGKSGALIARVQAGSAAEKAGLKAGDLILAMDGLAIGSDGDLRNAVGLKGPGASVSLTLWRSGKAQATTLTLGQPMPPAPPPQPRLATGVYLLGLMLTPVPKIDPRYGDVAGAYVDRVDPGSAADEAGIKEGDIITEAGLKAIAAPDQVANAVHAANGAPVLLRIRRGDIATLFAALG